MAAVADAPESCLICMEDYSKKRRAVTCQYCPSNACCGCQQRYLLQSFEDPHCMECKRGWGPEFMAANFPLLFRNNVLRRHRRKILFEREKAALPAFQIYAEYRRTGNELQKRRQEIMTTFGHMYYSDNTVDADIDENTVNGRHTILGRAVKLNRTKSMHAKMGIDQVNQKIATEGSTPESVAEMAGLKKEKAKLKAEWHTLREEFKEVDAKRKELLQIIGELSTAQWRTDAQYNDTWQAGAEAAPAAQKREFIMKCPDDGCRGFLSTAYKCGICSKWTCPDCMVVIGLEKDGAHTCDPNTVESAKAIKSETRPCPKCGTRIFKIDGCDQMWCVMEGCGTAFSWNTGQIVTGRVHNPHYYEWLRRNGGGAAPREAGDIPCGGIPGWYDMRDVWANRNIPAQANNSLAETHRNLVELQDMRLPGFPTRAPLRANKDVNVKYLLNVMDETEWQRQLELTEAAWRRKAEVGQVLQMAIAAAGDILRQIAQRSREATRDGVGQALMADWIEHTAKPDLEKLREFVNASLVALANREHIAVPQFGENWKWIPLRALYKKGVDLVTIEAGIEAAAAARKKAKREAAEAAVAALA
jgi:hypothetical protein